MDFVLEIRKIRERSENKKVIRKRHGIWENEEQSQGISTGCSENKSFMTPQTQLDIPVPVKMPQQDVMENSLRPGRSLGKEDGSVKVWCTKIARILRIVVQTGADLAVRLGN